MPFRVLPNGSIECDSIEEALQVQRRMANGTPHAPSATPPAVVPTEPENQETSKRLRKFIANLQPNGLRMVRAISESPTGLTTTELVERLGSPMTTRGIPPLVRHIVRVTEDAGFGTKTVVIRQSRFENRKPLSNYKIRNIFADELRSILPQPERAE